MATSVPLTGALDDPARARDLRRMKLLATGLFVAAALVYLACVLWGGDRTWVGYVEATAEASMVGALADWFAVTALFRHPLGCPSRTPRSSRARRTRSAPAWAPSCRRTS